MRRKLFVFCSVLLCLMLLALPCFAAGELAVGVTANGKTISGGSTVYDGDRLVASALNNEGTVNISWYVKGKTVSRDNVYVVSADDFSEATSEKDFRISVRVEDTNTWKEASTSFVFAAEKPVAEVTGVSLEVDGRVLGNEPNFVLTPETQLKAAFTGENLSFLTTDYKYKIGTKEGTLKDSNVTIADDGKRATIAINAADLKDLKEIALSCTKPNAEPVEAKYEILPYERTITVDDKISDKVSVNKPKAAKGTDVEITVNCGVEYILAELTVTHTDGTAQSFKAEDVKDGKVTFAMGDVDVTISAKFDEAPRFSISLLTMEHGEITLDAEPDPEGDFNKYSAPEGKVVKVSPIPDEGYKFDKLIVMEDANNHPIEPSADNTFIMPAIDVIVHATFVEAGGVTPVPGTPGTENPDSENPDDDNSNGENSDGENSGDEATDGETPDAVTSVLELLSGDMMMWVLIGAGVLVLIVVEVVIFTVVGKRRRRRRAAAAVVLKKISVRVESGVLVGREFDCFDSINIGRDASRCEIVFPMDSNNVGAVNNMLYFKSGKKELCLVDCGTGVTYFEDGTRAEPGNEYTLLPGSKFCVGSRKNQFVVYF